jgi:hypothetical protein
MIIKQKAAGQRKNSQTVLSSSGKKIFAAGSGLVCTAELWLDACAGVYV